MNCIQQKYNFISVLVWWVSEGKTRVFVIPEPVASSSSSGSVAIASGSGTARFVAPPRRAPSVSSYGLNFHTPCTFSLRRAKERSTAHGHRRKVR